MWLKSPNRAMSRHGSTLQTATGDAFAVRRCAAMRCAAEESLCMSAGGDTDTVASRGMAWRGNPTKPFNDQSGRVFSVKPFQPLTGEYRRAVT